MTRRRKCKPMTGNRPDRRTRKLGKLDREFLALGFELMPEDVQCIAIMGWEEPDKEANREGEAGGTQWSRMNRKNSPRLRGS